jgi:hypothetical protein
MRVKFGSFMAKAWARSFLAHCRAEMKPVLADSKSRAMRISDNAAALFWNREPSLPDKQTKALIASCCLVLAAYRELRGLLGEAEAYELVRNSVYCVYQKPMRFLVRAWLWLTRDPLKRLRGNRWRNQSRRMYGAGMQFDQEETENSVDLLVRRCAFHEFFLEHGEPELTGGYSGAAGGALGATIACWPLGPFALICTAVGAAVGGMVGSAGGSSMGNSYVGGAIVGGIPGTLYGTLAGMGIYVGVQLAGAAISANIGRWLLIQGLRAQLNGLLTARAILLAKIGQLTAAFAKNPSDPILWGQLQVLQIQLNSLNTRIAVLQNWIAQLLGGQG